MTTLSLSLFHPGGSDRLSPARTTRRETGWGGFQNAVSQHSLTWDKKPQAPAVYYAEVPAHNIWPTPATFAETDRLWKLVSLDGLDRSEWAAGASVRY